MPEQSSFIDPDRLRRWAERLAVLARSGDAELPQLDCAAWTAAFRDEAGHRRAVDASFFAWRLAARRNGLHVAAPAGAETRSPRERLRDAETDDSSHVSPPGAHAADVMLWTRLASLAEARGPGAVHPDAHIALQGRFADHTASSATTPAPGVAIEVWTETDLCAMHALHWLAWCSPDEPERTACAERARAAVTWHLEHTQPDNATNHPWGVHLFALEACADSPHAAEADLFAQSLAHNAVVSRGRPDRFSAHILADAADALEIARLTFERSHEPA